MHGWWYVHYQHPLKRLNDDHIMANTTQSHPIMYNITNISVNIHNCQTLCCFRGAIERFCHMLVLTTLTDIRIQFGTFLWQNICYWIPSIYQHFIRFTLLLVSTSYLLVHARTRVLLTDLLNDSPVHLPCPCCVALHARTMASRDWENNGTTWLILLCHVVPLWCHNGSHVAMQPGR